MTKPVPATDTPRLRAPRFDLPDLRLYVAVVEAGSLSRGAVRLPLALSAASARLRLLEERLGQTLLERRPHGVVPTHAGQLFFDYARRVVQAAQDAQLNMDRLQAQGRLTLRVYSNTVGISTDLPTRLGAFLARYPLLDLQLEQRPSRDVIRAISAGEADVGIVDDHYPAGELVSLPFQRDRLLAICSENHALSQQKVTNFAELATSPLVGLPASSSLQAFIERIALLARLPVHFRAVAPSFGTVAQLVAQGVGVALLPAAAALRYGNALPLHVLELSDDWAQRGLQIYVRPLADLSAPARQLAGFLAGVEPG